MDLAKRLAQLYFNNVETLYQDSTAQRTKDTNRVVINRKDMCDHLLWMCQQIVEQKNWHATKAHRWIGFVQGTLWVMRVFSIDDLQDHVNMIMKELT